MRLKRRFLRDTNGSVYRRTGAVPTLAVLLLAALAPLVMPRPAAAAPGRIILLRHGEKDGPWQLCAVGRARAEALVSYYLGKGAQNSLFRPGETPAAILALSLHTLESIDPVARSWGLPVIFYSVMPEYVDGTARLSQETLHQRNREAIRAVLENPAWAGKTLVMSWEHDHIAKTRYDIAVPQGPIAPGQAEWDKMITLYDLMGLYALPDVPDNWPQETYDYFWIIDFDPATGRPATLTMVKQEFGPPFTGVPHNDWGTPEGLTAADGCTP